MQFIPAPKIVQSPITANGFSPMKDYKVILASCYDSDNGWLLRILDDKGKRRCVNSKKSCHLDGRNWIIVN